MCLFFFKAVLLQLYYICQSRTAKSDRWWWIIECFSRPDFPVNPALKRIRVQLGKIWDAHTTSFVTPEKPGQASQKKNKKNIGSSSPSSVKVSALTDDLDLQICTCECADLESTPALLIRGLRGRWGRRGGRWAQKLRGAFFFFGTFVIPDRLINTDWMKRDWVNPVCLVWPKSQQGCGGCRVCVCCVVCLI